MAISLKITLKVLFMFFDEISNHWLFPMTLTFEKINLPTMSPGLHVETMECAREDKLKHLTVNAPKTMEVNIVSKLKFAKLNMRRR